MYPAPVPNGDGRSNYISAPSDYILVRNGEYNHTFLIDEDLEDCTKLDKQWYYKNPTIFLTDSCEVHLLRDPGRLNINTCNMKDKLHNTTEWIYFQESDEWIYSAPVNDTLVISCNNNVSFNETIGRLGLLKLTRGCIATNHHYVLSPRDKTSKVEYIYTLMDPLNLTRYHEVSMDKIIKLENDPRLSRMKTLIYISYCIWLISVVLSFICAALLTRWIYKQRTPPPQQPKKNARPEIIHLQTQGSQTIYTSLYHKSESRDAEYSTPPRPKPILVHPPLVMKVLQQCPDLHINKI